MGLIRICVLLLPLIWALTLQSRRTSPEAAAMLFLSLASGGYLLSLLSLQAAGVWMLRGLWAVAVCFLLYRLLRDKAKACPDFSLLLVAAGLAFLWWIDRGRQFLIWDEFSHWGMAAKSLFQEGRLVGLVSNSGDNFAEYPPALAPFSYLILSAVGYSFREDLVLYLQSVFLLALLWYPLHICPPKKNPVVLFGGAALLFLVPLMCYPSSYTGILVDCLLGVMGGFVVLAAALSQQDSWDTALVSLGAFVLSAAVKSTGILFAVVGCLVYFLLHAKSTESAGRNFSFRAVIPFAAALSGKLSWMLFCTIHHISSRGAAQAASVGYRRVVLEKFAWNIFADFNYGSFLHFPFVLWAVLLLFAYFGIRRAAAVMDKKSRTALRYSFWASWGFLLVFTASVLFSYMFFFAEGEAVALASLSRYLNSALTMLLFVVTALFCVVATQYRWKHQLVGMAAALLFWAEGASPSSGVILHDLLTAPTQAGESVNFNRSYRVIAAWIETKDDPDAANLYLVSQQDFGFAYIAMNYQLFPATIPDQLSSISSHADADPTYTNYDTPEQWADMVASGYTYLCLHNVDNTFVSDFGALFDDPGQIQNGAIFKAERQSDGSVRFVPVDLLAW